MNFHPPRVSKCLLVVDMKKQQEYARQEPKASTSRSTEDPSEQGGGAVTAGGASATTERGGDFGDASQYEELNPIGTGEESIHVKYVYPC